MRVSDGGRRGERGAEAHRSRALGYNTSANAKHKRGWWGGWGGCGGDSRSAERLPGAKLEAAAVKHNITRRLATAEERR